MINCINGVCRSIVLGLYVTVLACLAVDCWGRRIGLNFGQSQWVGVRHGMNEFRCDLDGVFYFL